MFYFNQYAPFKKGSKGSHAERARQLGLGEPAELLLKDPKSVQLETFIQPNTEGMFASGFSINMSRNNE